MDMTPIDDRNAKEWLTKYINWKDVVRPLTLKNFFPPIFDNYIAVLWTPGIIDNFPFDKIVQPPDTIEQTNNNVAVWRQFKIFLNQENDEPYRPTTFSELASLFKITHNRQIINSLPWQTEGIKTLFKPTRQRLEKIITALLQDNELNIYFEDYWRWASVYNLLPSDEGVVYKITVSDFMDFMDKSFYDASLYLYPQSKNWCLLNLEDLGYNILAFNNNLADIVAQLNLQDTFKMRNDELLYE